MYLRGSKWNMRQRRQRINWFLVVVVLILIAIVAYVDRFILPTAQTPFMATLTATRDPEAYVTDAESLFAEGKLLPAIDSYMEAIRIKLDDPSLYIALARVQVFAGNNDEALERRFTALLSAHPDDLPKYLRQAISFLKSKEISINWEQLFSDLQAWGHAERRTNVQKSWARAFWGGRTAEVE